VRVLVIEDERRLASALQRGLRAEGFAVDVAHDGGDGLHLAREGGYDVVVLDIMLPTLSGYRICAQLRDDGNPVPVLMLTAKDGEYDEADGLDAGADDYLTKLFAVGELLARLRVALRHADARVAPSAEQVITSGELRIDLAARRVILGGRDVRLTPTEYRLLATLARHAGMVVTHRQLLREVWGPSYVEHTHYLRVHMAQLRQKLETNSAQPRHLLTELGVGYRLVAE
jgi:DNA-binding response OmpR family regulator